MQEKVSDSSSKPPVHMAGRPNVAPYPLPVLPMDDDEISAKGKSDLLWADWFGWWTHGSVRARWDGEV